MRNWEDRYRLQLPAYEELKTLNLKLSDFSNGTKNYNNEKFKAVVLSIQGDYSRFSDFSLEVEKVAFTDSRLLELLSHGKPKLCNCIFMI
ncbi:hypothetical protein RM553_13365 [Zunongwangia sp. F363]|uniref:Uncharacterized protein n=1 Tax=Autumnicola tepida TaxID=3075595 RepID=A0ABU3CBV9_9FLAO|nr:hypothetical protein [Zunongwangia sp. F363]MDT0643823.1 hypothetical protein [Zunongwangia sp. F363]